MSHPGRLVRFTRLRRESQILKRFHGRECRLNWEEWTKEYSRLVVNLVVVVVVVCALHPIVTYLGWTRQAESRSTLQIIIKGLCTYFTLESLCSVTRQPHFASRFLSNFVTMDKMHVK